jgi:hypothetical protein
MVGSEPDNEAVIVSGTVDDWVRNRYLRNESKVFIYELLPIPMLKLLNNPY